MRVLFLNHNVIGSGTFSRAFQLARQLAGRGYRVTLITTSRTARLRALSYERDGVEMIEAPDLLTGRARTGWDPYNTWKRITLVDKRAFDIVHAFDSRPVVIYPALRTAARNQALFVMDWADWWGRGGWTRDRSGWLVRATFGPIEGWFEEAYRTEAHGMTVASRALAERSVSLGIARDRVHLLPGGCAPAQSPRQPRSEARSQLGVHPDVGVVLHVGVLTRGDYDFLYQAFARVRAARPAVMLVLAGRTGMRVSGGNGNSSIRTTGYIDEATLRAWLAAADVCVVPCRDTIGNRGRWPSKVNDYLTSERAVVMPRVSDAAAAIESAAAGWVTEPTVSAFGDGIVRALTNRTEADAAGARGRTLAEGELAWARLTDQLVAFYDRIAVTK